MRAQLLATEHWSLLGTRSTTWSEVMSRIRAAYLEIDPGIASVLVTAATDDYDGLSRTYTMGMRRSTFSHVLASTSMFVIVFNGIVAGTLGALVAHAAGAATVLTSVVGSVAGLTYVLVMLDWGRRTFKASQLPGQVLAERSRPVPSPAPDPQSR